MSPTAPCSFSTTVPTHERTGEQWARAILEGAPASTRAAAISAWSALGLRLGWTRSDQLVLGWELRRSTPDFALLAAGSPLGLSAEVLFKRRRETFLFATFVELKNPGARAPWAGVAPAHRQGARYLLAQAAGRLRADRRRWPGA
jgi:hypothetical protein